MIDPRSILGGYLRRKFSPDDAEGMAAAQSEATANDLDALTARLAPQEPAPLQVPSSRVEVTVPDAAPPVVPLKWNPDALQNKPLSQAPVMPGILGTQAEDAMRARNAPSMGALAGHMLAAKPVDPEEAAMRAAQSADDDARFARNVGTIGSNFTANLLGVGKARDIEAAPSQVASLKDALARKHQKQRMDTEAAAKAKDEALRGREADLREKAITAAEEDRKAKLEQGDVEAKRKAAIAADEAEHRRVLEAQGWSKVAIDKRMAEIAAGKPAAAEKKQSAATAAELRKEYNSLPDTKQFGEVDGSFRKIQSAATNPSAAGDLALITGFMKIIDPGSSVKEGEFANAQNAGGVPDKIRAAYNNVASGQRLTKEQRADFVKQSKVLYDVHKSRFDAQTSRYRSLAQKADIDPDDVTGSVGTTAPETRAGPPAGKVHVSNGKEDFYIDAADVKAAVADGFEVLK